MPRKRKHVNPHDEEIYMLEREIVYLQRNRERAREMAETYDDMGFEDYATAKRSDIRRYNDAIRAVERQIRQLRHESVLEGVGD